MIHILNIGTFTFFSFTHIKAIGKQANLAIASAPSLYTYMLCYEYNNDPYSANFKFSYRDLTSAFSPSHTISHINY